MTDDYFVDQILRGHMSYWNMLGKLRGNKNHIGAVCWLSGNIYYSYSTKLNGTDYDGQINAIINDIQNKELPPNLTLLPNSGQKDVDLLSVFLETKNFKLDYSALGMAKLLNADMTFHEADNRLAISRVTGPQQLKISGAVFNAAFEYDVFTYEHYLDAFDMPNVSFYLAEFSGLPVGACMAISESEAIEIAWVAVLPGYRKKGIAGFLIGAAEKDAVNNGKLVSVLSAFEGAVNAYRRVAYQPYCKIDVINYIKH